MDTSMRMPGMSPAMLPGTGSAQSDSGGLATPASQSAPAPGVQVTISPEARAAEEAARVTAAAQTSEAPAAPQGGAQSANPVQAAVTEQRTEATVSATSVPAANAEADIAQRANAAPQALQSEAPDASSGESSQALQLYLENAVRPDNQPARSAIRETA